MWCASVVLLCTSSPLNKSDYTDLSFAESVVFYSNAFPPVIRSARHRHRRVGGVPASRRRRRCRRAIGPSQWRRLRRGYTHTTIRWAVWTRRPDCVNLGRYRVRVQKRMYNDGNDENNNNNISFVCLSFRMLFVFLSIFLVFLFYPIHAQQTRVYDRAPDGKLESAGLYLYDIFVSFFFFGFIFRFWFFSTIISAGTRRERSTRG